MAPGPPLLLLKRKAATGSAGGEGIQRWLGGGHSPRADSAPGAGSLGPSLQSMVSGQEEPVRMELRLPAVCRGVRVLVSLPCCKGIRMRKPARPAGAGAGAAISCSALPKRSPYFSDRKSTRLNSSHLGISY